MCMVCMYACVACDVPVVIIVFEGKSYTFNHVFSCHRSRALTQHGFSALLLLLLLLCWTSCCCCPHHSCRCSMSFVESSIKQTIHVVSRLFAFQGEHCRSEFLCEGETTPSFTAEHAVSPRNLFVNSA